MITEKSHLSPEKREKRNQAGAFASNMEMQWNENALISYSI